MRAPCTLPLRVKRHFFMEIDIVGQHEDLLYAAVTFHGFSQNSLDKRTDDKEDIAVQARYWIIENNDAVDVYPARRSTASD